MFKRKTLLAVALAGAVVGLAPASLTPVHAADLTIGLQNSTTSMDPQWITSPANWGVNHHIFDPLIRTGNDGRIEPWLAKSWERVDDVTWEFALRDDVKWHDGTPFTAEDVVFSYERARNVPNSPNPFTIMTKYFDQVTAPDPHTLRIVTKGPAPALLYDLSYILLVSKHIGSTASTEDYNSGKAAIGTGAYKFSSFSLNDQVVVTRNDDYWGEKQPWDKVTLRAMPQDAPRTASLLAGDIDVMESVPTSDVEQLKTNPKLSVYSVPTGRVAYLAFDAGEEALESGRIVGMDGQPLKENPFADKRVREALKLAVDLDQFVGRIYRGQALATGQYLLPDVDGYIPDLGPWKADMDRARKLLEEAGWADKFKITLGVADAVFQNGSMVAQGLAQAWTRIGVPTEVMSMAYPVFLSLRNERKMPVQLMTRQNSWLVADTLYSIIIYSSGGSGGKGVGNYAHYSNPTVDKLIDTAMVTMDDAEREKMYQEVGRLAVEDAQITPLWLLNETTATKASLSFVARPDRAIYAMNVRAKD